MADILKEKGIDLRHQKKIQPIVLINNSDITHKKSVESFLKLILPHIPIKIVVNLLDPSEHCQNNS